MGAPCINDRSHLTLRTGHAPAAFCVDCRQRDLKMATEEARVEAALGPDGRTALMELREAACQAVLGDIRKPEFGLISASVVSAVVQRMLKSLGIEIVAR